MSVPDPIALAAQVADLAAQAEALSAREAALAEREALAAKQAEGLRRGAVIAFCDGLATEARIHPEAVPALAEIVLRLEQTDPAPCFASASDPEAPAPAGPWLRAFLASLPPLVELSEVATHGRTGAGKAPSDEEVASRARAYRAQQAAAGQPLSFAAAVAAVELNQDRTGS